MDEKRRVKFRIGNTKYNYYVNQDGVKDGKSRQYTNGKETVNEIYRNGVCVKRELCDPTGRIYSRYIKKGQNAKHTIFDEDGKIINKYDEKIEK